MFPQFDRVNPKMVPVVIMTKKRKVCKFFVTLLSVYFWLPFQVIRRFGKKVDPPQAIANSHKKPKRWMKLMDFFKNPVEHSVHEKLVLFSISYQELQSCFLCALFKQGTLIKRELSLTLSIFSFFPPLHALQFRM